MPMRPQTYYDEFTANASGLNANGPCAEDARGCIPQTLDECRAPTRTTTPTLSS